ncbi:hypothetical protein J4E91_009489 [Alternaria rosae]|nr:hypothetical protein J4E91_009489 [Alternaria rosae]
MTITANAVVEQTFLLSPTPITTTSHASVNTLPGFPGAQTFRLSPTVTLSPTSFRTDSPVLPPTPPSPAVTLFHANHILRTSRSSEDLPVYPISRNFHEGSISSLNSSGSPSGDSDLSTVPTAKEEDVVSTTRMSDILPDDLDLYSEKEDEQEENEEEISDTRQWSIALTDAAQDVVREQDEKIQHLEKTGQKERSATEVEWETKDLELGPEVQVDGSIEGRRGSEEE